MAAELLIQNGKKIYAPLLQEDITWETEREGSAGKLTFKILKDSRQSIANGNSVRFRWNGHNIFYGFIFSIKRDQSDSISITAYDQLRYFKNKDTYVYEDKTAGWLVKKIAKDYNLKTGTIADTGYKIPSRVEDNQSLFDIVQTAIDLTIQNKGRMFILYDSFGKLTLTNIANMKFNLLVSDETAEGYDYTNSIDANVYNKIKLYYDNDDAGTRDVFIAKSSANINKWGVLQFTEKLQEGENGKTKANAYLSLYNHVQKSLSVKNQRGDYRVRAGSLVPVVLNVGDTKINHYMLVESCKHTFKLNQHVMDLGLRGGNFVV